MKRLEAQRYADPDRRYWRRRANRTLRRDRRTRAALRWVGILGVNATVLVALGMVAVRTVDHATTSPEFALSFVEIDGARLASEQGVREEVERYRGQNLFVLDLEEIASRVEARPWVLRASVKRLLPRGIRVTLTERSPLARTGVNGTMHVVDDSGFVIGPADGAGSFDDLPVLRGPEALEGESFHRLLSRGVDALLRLREAHPAWAANIVDIDLSRNDRIVVTSGGPGPRVLLDPVEIERNVDHFLALKGEIESRIGRAEYVDLRWRDRISLMPATGS
jgi:cell division septal protein FtsQ